MAVFTDNDHKGKTQKERIKEITEQLEAGVAAVFESDAYKAYLNCMSKFHNYSLNNTLLIALQRPDAQLCASYSSWQRDHGRQVRKGEKGKRAGRLRHFLNAPGVLFHLLLKTVEGQKDIRLRLRAGEAEAGVLFAQLHHAALHKLDGRGIGVGLDDFQERVQQEVPPSTHLQPVGCGPS